MFDYDSIPQLPCSGANGGMPACDADSSSKIAQLLKLPGPPVNTGNNGTAWMYVTTGGTLLFFPTDMPVQPLFWKALTNNNVCDGMPFELASHVCFYDCMLSSYVLDPNNQCLLWDPANLGIKVNGHSVCSGGAVRLPGAHLVTGLASFVSNVKGAVEKVAAG